MPSVSNPYRTPPSHKSYFSSSKPERQTLPLHSSPHVKRSTYLRAVKQRKIIGGVMLTVLMCMYFVYGNRVVRDPSDVVSDGGFVLKSGINDNLTEGEANVILIDESTKRDIINKARGVTKKNSIPTVVGGSVKDDRDANANDALPKKPPPIPSETEPIRVIAPTPINEEPILQTTPQPTKPPQKGIAHTPNKEEPTPKAATRPETETTPQPTTPPMTMPPLKVMAPTQIKEEPIPILIPPIIPPPKQPQKVAVQYNPSASFKYITLKSMTSHFLSVDSSVSFKADGTGTVAWSSEQLPSSSFTTQFVGYDSSGDSSDVTGRELIEAMASLTLMQNLIQTAQTSSSSSTTIHHHASSDYNTQIDTITNTLTNLNVYEPPIKFLTKLPNVKALSFLQPSLSQLKTKSKISLPLESTQFALIVVLTPYLTSIRHDFLTLTDMNIVLSIVNNRIVLYEGGKTIFTSSTIIKPHSHSPASASGGKPVVLAFTFDRIDGHVSLNVNGEVDATISKFTFRVEADAAFTSVVIGGSSSSSSLGDSNSHSGGNFGFVGEVHEFLSVLNDNEPNSHIFSDVINVVLSRYGSSPLNSIEEDDEEASKACELYSLSDEFKAKREAFEKTWREDSSNTDIIQKLTIAGSTKESANNPNKNKSNGSTQGNSKVKVARNAVKSLTPLEIKQQNVNSISTSKAPPRAGADLSEEENENENAGSTFKKDEEVVLPGWLQDLRKQHDEASKLAITSSETYINMVKDEHLSTLGLSAADPDESNASSPLKVGKCDAGGDAFEGIELTLFQQIPSTSPAKYREIKWLPPPSTRLEDVNVWKEAVRKSMSKIEGFKKGGEELRALVREEKRALVEMRSRMFCLRE